MNECKNVHNDTGDESIWLQLSDITTHTDTQNSAVNDLVECSDARQSVNTMQVDTNVCVSMFV